MSRNWESWFQTAAQPASATEEAKRDRTEARIRDAISASSEIPPGSVKVYVKGSYTCNTNVRQNSDVDVCVEWQDSFHVSTLGETTGMGPAELGYEPASESSKISSSDFRSRIERALISQFGSSLVDTNGNKVIDVTAASNTLDADVLPCFWVRRYDKPHVFHDGQRLYPKSGSYIDNFPQQNYDNGVTKNRNTSQRFKKVVRCIKRLETEMFDEGRIPRDYPGYLIECLIYNVPNPKFGAWSLTADVKAVFDWLWNATNSEEEANKLEEVSNLLYLFRGHFDRSAANAHNFIDAAWRRVLE